LELAESIVSNSDDPADKVQYSTLIALDQFVAMQFEDAKTWIDRSVNFVSSADPDLTDRRFENVAANALYFSGKIRKEREPILEALTRFEGLLADDDLSDRGKAMLHRSIGECHRDLGRWTESLASFEAAFELEQFHIGLNRMIPFEGVL